MRLSLNDPNAVRGYKSRSQIVRILTENWFEENMYCPACGNLSVRRCKDNTPLIDFWCEDCNKFFQLKSRGTPLGSKVVDAAHNTMIQAIISNKIPNFFFLHYVPDKLMVHDLVAVPNYFIGVEHIEKRKPLPPTARRAGWVGCNILFGNIPKEGRISVIQNGSIRIKEKVVKQWADFDFISKQRIENRGWIYDILICINRLGKEQFTLSELYGFEELLSHKHPTNFNIKPKIRQQLQILRDKGLLRFERPGEYRRLWK